MNLRLPLTGFQSILFNRARWSAEDADVKRSCLLFLYDHDLYYAGYKHNIGKFLQPPSRTRQRTSNAEGNLPGRLNGSS